MGRIARIAKAVLREMNFGRVQVIKIPEPIESESMIGHAAFIAGGSSGIGLEIARALSCKGCRVFIAGSTPEKLARAVEDISSPLVSSILLDLQSVADIGEAINLAARQCGDSSLDIFVNSAGVADFSTMKCLDEKTFDRIMNVNVKGAYFFAHHAALFMRNAGVQGHILNVSSSSALRNAKSAYEISKWAVKGMTLGLAEEYINDGIVVNALAPGPTETPMLGYGGEATGQKSSSPAGRLAHPQEIANLAIVLLSDAGNLVVGDTLYATGGSGTISLDR